ncbi:Ionotropic receptor 144, partial [Diabrotica virgifera virgifera]
YYLTTALDACINEIITPGSPTDENIYLVNTNIRISRPAVYYDTEQELKLFNKKPTFYIISGNISNNLQTLYIKERLNRYSVFIIIIKHFNRNISELLKYYFVNKALIVTDIINASRHNYKTNSYNRNMRHKYLSLTKCYGHSIYPLNIIGKKKNRRLRAICPFSPPYVNNSTSGLYISIIKLITERLKIKVKYYVSNTSSSSHLMATEFVTRNFDLYVGPLLTVGTEKYFYSKSVFILCDTPIYVFPRREKTNYLRIICDEFSLTIWCWFLGLVTLIHFLFYIFEKIILSGSEIPTFTLLRILLEGGAPIKIKKNSFKILFTTFLLFALIFTTLYKTKMFDILKGGFSYNLYNTEEDILKYGLKVGLTDMAFSIHFKISIDPIQQIIFNNNLLEECGNYENCLNITATRKYLVSTTTLRYLQYILPTYFLDEQGKSMFHVSHITLGPMFMGLAVLKDHPQLNTFNRYFSLLREGGFIDHFQKNNDWKYQKAMALASTTKRLNSARLPLKSFETVFLLYFVGIVLSLFIFLMELMIRNSTHLRVRRCSVSISASS